MRRAKEIRALSLFFALLACASSAACGGGEDESIDVDEAMDSVELSQNESAIVIGLVARLDPAEVDPNVAAQKAALQAGLVFRPAECVKAETRDNTVHYVLSGCTGPLKTAKIEGTLDVVYTVGGDGLHALGTATGLRVGLATLDIDSEGFYSLAADGATKSLAVKTNGTGTGRRGHRIEREGAYTVTWNEAEKCATLEGAYTSRVGTRVFRTSVTDLARCSGECPTAGGEIVYEAVSQDISIRISFDGTSQASWEMSTGGGGKIDLLCVDGV